MSSRTRAADEFGTICGRLEELRREALGCVCERDPHSGVLNHKPECSMGPGLPPATPPRSALAILADHRAAVADWAESHIRHKLWAGPEEYTKGMGGCAVDCPHPDHGDTVIDWTYTASSGA